jgi:hypothetical protein
VQGCVFLYTLEYLKWHLCAKIQKVYPFQEYVNFGYGISSKIPEVLGKVEMKILTHSPFYKTEDFPLLE